MENITLTDVPHRVTINDEPQILTNRVPSIKGLSRHSEAVQERIKKNTQTIFEFFQKLGLNPHIEYIKNKWPMQAQPMVKASFMHPKSGERVEISFLYGESPREGEGAYTHFNKGGCQINTFRKLYSEEVVK